MDVVAIIPARGGSKRIPRKAIYPLCGKPLIAYTILHAKSSKLVNRIVVSTDAVEISEISKEYGAEVIIRPAEISNDKASSESALIHVLNSLKDKENYNPDIIVFLQCTSPSRNDDDIDNAIDVFLKQKADSLFSACRFNKYIWHQDSDVVQSINYDYKKRWREQDFPIQYMENGSIYVFKPWVLNSLGNRLGGKIVIYEMDYINSFQIDTMVDLELSEYILERRN